MALLSLALGSALGGQKRATLSLCFSFLLTNPSLIF